MKNSIFKGKSTRTKIFSVISIVGIVLIFGLNLLITGLFGNNALYADLTPEGFYTVTENMEKACSEIFNSDSFIEAGKKIKIIFCTDPDYLTASSDLRATYFMAIKLRNMFDGKIEVETKNVLLDPTSVQSYKTTSRDTINPYDIIVAYGDKYRIADATAFWKKSSSDNSYFSYDGEYKMASIFASLTDIERPVAYFTTGHGETVYDPDDPDSESSQLTLAFAELLIDRGFEIKLLELSSNDIPDDCSLLIINNPTIDFTPDESKLTQYDYVSDLEKIDRYLLSNPRAVILNKSYEVTLPSLESFIKEWGIEFGNAQVFDAENYLFASNGENPDESVFTAVYDTDEESLGYAYYGSYATLSSSPRMVFSNTGYLKCSFDDGEKVLEQGNMQADIEYAHLIGTSSKAYYKIESDGGIAEVDGTYTLAAMGVRQCMDSYTGTNDDSYIFCTNSAEFFSNELLGNSSYANYDIMASIISNISRTERFASIDLGGGSPNSSSYGGKQIISTVMSEEQTTRYLPNGASDGYNSGLSSVAVTIYAIVVMLPVAAVLVIGTVVFIKRKFL